MESRIEKNDMIRGGGGGGGCGVFFGGVLLWLGLGCMRGNGIC
jgi:hypothetical protein